TGAPRARSAPPSAPSAGPSGSSARPAPRNTAGRGRPGARGTAGTTATTPVRPATGSSRPGAAATTTMTTTSRRSSAPNPTPSTMMTTMTTAGTPTPTMTTDPDRGTSGSGLRRRLEQWGAFSVRTRITVAFVLVSAIALFSAGFFVFTIEVRAIERDVRAQIDQELAEFEQLAVRGFDETGSTFDDAASLLRVLMERNVPDDAELLIGYAGDRAAVISPTRYAETSSDPGTGLRDLIHRAVVPLLETGGAERIDDPEHGDVIVTVQPVDAQGSPGALVVVNFLADEYSELDSFIRTYAVLAILMLGAIAVLSSFQAGRLLRPVRTLRETAQSLSASDLSRRIPEQGNDDITDLTRTVNQMFDRLEQAFRTPREFLDDAGHELKTPLTIMSRHLELLDPHDPADVEATRELLLDETDRMSRLV